MSLSRPIHALTAAAAVVAVALGPAAQPAPAATAPPLPTADRLKSALLTAADLGPGWTATPVTQGAGSAGSGGTAEPVTGCAGLNALITMHSARTGTRIPQAAVALDGPNGTPMVTQALAAEATDRLTADYNTAADALRTCHSITFNGGANDRVTFTVSPVTLGDRKEAPAVHLTGTLAGVQLNGYVGIERFGNVAMAFGYFERMGDSKQAASTQYRKAVAKVERTLGAKAGSTTPVTAVPTGQRA
ncbi:hypothetical protein [Kitasatospora brasiliensis]|uniref:hypothetical protein n=1 Tax=Kitasatospora brasiliensis TaxID=3058040 RepID=UPI00292F13F1|nr:hypothetical protein [Kitasatospora sp. K002]